MTVYRIPKRELLFPPVDEAEPDGLLGVGGDVSPQRMLLAYESGIFPWYSAGRPILWFSPDPRFVLVPSELHVGRSLAKRARAKPYDIRFDTAFRQVVAECGRRPRPGQDGTWITPELEASYAALHDQGLAHSIEAWAGEQLVGGLFGVALGRLFVGESMFANAADASKLAFVGLVERLVAWDFELVDCQVRTAHLERFGGKDMPRSAYIAGLAKWVPAPGHVGRWTLSL